MIISVDVGSGSIRAGLVDLDGACRHRLVASTDDLVIEVDPVARAFEVDAVRLRDRVHELVAALRRTAHDEGIEVDGLVCTSIRYAFALVDAAGHVVVAVPNVDRRAAGRAAQLRQRPPEEIRARGVWPSPLTAWPRLLELVREGGAALRGMTWLPLHAWLLTTLGATPHCDAQSAAESGLRVVTEDRWTDEGDLGGIRFPPVVPPGAPVGTLSAGAAQSTPVALHASAGDTGAAVAALSDLEVGDVVAVAGSTTPMVLVAGAPPETAAAWSTATWLPGGPSGWLAERNAGRTGAVVRQVYELLGGDDRYGSLDAAFDRLDPAVVVDADVHLGPQIVEPREFGSATIRRRVAEAGPGSAPLRDRCLLAGVVAANAWATAHHVARLRTLGPAGRLVVCGGQARDRRFAALLAGATGEAVHLVPESEATMIGAAAGVLRGTGRRPLAGIAVRDCHVVAPPRESPQHQAAMHRWVTAQGQVTAVEDG